MQKICIGSSYERGKLLGQAVTCLSNSSHSMKGERMLKTLCISFWDVSGPFLSASSILLPASRVQHLLNRILQNL